MFELNERVFTATSSEEPLRDKDMNRAASTMDVIHQSGTDPAAIAAADTSIPATPTKKAGRPRKRKISPHPRGNPLKAKRSRAPDHGSEEEIPLTTSPVHTRAYRRAIAAQQPAQYVRLLSSLPQR